jgi:hypothetical protein
LLSYFVHNLIVKRKGVPTIIKLVKLHFDRELSIDDVWRIDAMVGANVRYGLREPSGHPLSGIGYESGDESGDQSQGGYENTNPQLTSKAVADSRSIEHSSTQPYDKGSPRAIDSKQTLREEMNVSDMEVLKQNKLLTYGKGPLSPIRGVSGRSRAQVETDVAFHNKSRREKRVWEAVENGVIPKDAVDLYLEHFDPKTRRTIPAELKLPRGRKGGRKPKEKPNPLYENQMVAIEKGREE